MDGYRHLTLLVRNETHQRLKEASFKENLPIAYFVRRGIAIVLGEKEKEGMLKIPD